MAVAIAGLLLAVVVGLTDLVHRFVRMESLEQADAWVEHALRTTAREIDAGLEASDALTELDETIGGGLVAARIDGAAGAHTLWRHWPESGHVIEAVPGEDARRLSEAHLLARDNVMIGSRPLANGDLLRVALSLAPFAEEADEIGHRLHGVALASAVAVLFIAGAATWWGFAPLRAATRLLERMDPRDFKERIAERGTSDPVDAHARLLNRRLDDVERALEQLRAFSADVAHEFRTPLNRVATIAEVALEGDDKEMESALLSIQGTIDEMARLVEALLLISEVDSARVGRARQKVDLGARAREVAALYEALLTERGSTVEVDVSEAVVEGHPDLLDRVLVNLVENVVEHAGVGCAVAIRCRREGDRVRLEVEDSGVGIDREAREAVFDRFVQIRSAVQAGLVSGRTDRGRSGSGLGLAVARSIVRLHGGEIRIVDGRLGGACFVCELPAWDPGAARDAAGSPPPGR